MDVPALPGHNKKQAAKLILPKETDKMNNPEIIEARLSSLRRAMTEDGVDFYLMTSSDPHASEYVSDHFKTTEYYSGCTSDNVVLIISAQDALLWTDSRYHISAAVELDGTSITLMKEGLPGVPAPMQYLKGQFTQHAGTPLTLGFDGACLTALQGERYEKLAKDCGVLVKFDCDAASRVWDQDTKEGPLSPRPALPSHPVWIVPDDLAGRTYAEKLAEVRETLSKKGAQNLILSKLDDIMWLTNLRGGDVECNPVALSYAILTPAGLALFVQESELTDKVRIYAAENEIMLKPYESFYEALAGMDFEGGVFIDRGAVSSRILRILEEKEQKDKTCGMKIVSGANPTALLKTIKNPVEIENSRKFYLLDSVALCKFIYKIKQAAAKARQETSDHAIVPLRDETGTPLTEYSAAMMLDSMRAEIDGFFGLSFGTISAYGANAAMAHYSASADNCSVVEPHGFLLVDSGGQYYGATTDVTRTIAVGNLTDQMKRDFTLVAAANLRLLTAKFTKGTTGAQLDFLARGPLYAHGLDFGHGTGHGIGYILNVHEGPQRIGPHRPGSGSGVAFEPGMITSDEPGIYREGEYGIRTESIVLTVPDEENEFGVFYRMDPLTFVPIDLEAIDPKYLDGGDIARLNTYHKEVYEKVAPLLAEEEAAWLKEATRAI